MIYAVLNKARGRGHLRHYQAFCVHTDVQNEVENFMLSLGFTIDQYWLTKKENFIIQKEYPHLLLHDVKGKQIWVLETDVKVKRTVKGYRFVVVFE